MNQAIYYFISINLDCMLFLQVVTWNTNIQRVPEISKTYKISRNVNCKLLIDKQKPNFCDMDCYTVSLARRLITVTIVVIPPLRFSERLGFRIFKFPWSARAGSTRLSNKRKKNTPFQHSIDARTRTPAGEAAGMQMKRKEVVVRLRLGVSCAVASRVGVSVVGSSTSTPTRVIGVLIELLLEVKEMVGGWERVSLSFRIET